MKPIEFRCNPDGTVVPLPHNWEHTIGSDHAPMALRADYQDQLKKCHDELGIRHVRFHGLFGSDMGTLVQHGDALVSSFHNAHVIWDFLLSIGMKPFVELSFMPEPIASGRSTVFHYRANITPPRRYVDWAALVHELATSAVERFGASEVSTWPFEVWNEPNLRAFWRGTREQYLRLYSATALTLKDVHPDIPVGGPASADNGWIDEFLDHCDRNDVPADFVSTHHYPNDASLARKGDMETRLAQTQRSILREQAQDARRRARGKPLYYTEWNSSTDSRFPLHDESYSAAFIVKTLLEGCGIADVYSFWTFSDLFEEGYFSSRPFHGGFGLMTIHGVRKPSYRAFELLHMIGDELVTPLDGMHPTVDAWVTRSSRTRDVAVLITNHTYPRQVIVPERVLVHLETPRTPRSARLVRIDDANANPKRKWMEIGSPMYPSQSQVDKLHDASAMHFRPCLLNRKDGKLDVEVDIPPQGVAIAFIEFED
jgi:xylan 1,4-beta-xylosidase